MVPEVGHEDCYIIVLHRLQYTPTQHHAVNTLKPMENDDVIVFVTNLWYHIPMQGVTRIVQLANLTRPTCRDAKFRLK